MFPSMDYHGNMKTLLSWDVQIVHCVGSQCSLCARFGLILSFTNMSSFLIVDIVFRH